MTAALPRMSGVAHPRLTADDNAVRIVSALRLLPSRRDLIDYDELRLIEMARAWGWSWADIAAAYPYRAESGMPWSVEGVRRRWLILDAKRRAESVQNVEGNAPWP